MENVNNNSKAILNNKRIKIAGLGRRGLAFVVDILIVGVLSMILWMTVGNVVLNNLGTATVIEEQRDFALDSGLCWETENENGTREAGFYLNSYAYAAGMNSTTSDSSTVELGYGYALYLDITFDTYTNFFANDPRMNQSISVLEHEETVTYTPSEYYTGKRFGVELLELPNPDTISSADALIEGNIDDESHLFKWVVDENGHIDTQAKPVLTVAAQEQVEAGNNEVLRSLRAIFYTSGDNSYGGAYYDVYSTLVAQDYYINRSNEYLYHQWISLAVFYLPLTLIVFFIVPLCFKDGQTIGKKLLGICLIGKDGYAITWGPHILHPLVNTIIVASAVIIPWNILMAYIGMLMFMVLCVIDYMFGFLSKGTNQLISDRLGMTYTIDARSSIWFASKDVEEDYEKSHSTLRPKSGFFDEPISEEENLRYAQMDAILDLSTIDRHRKEAAAITSFDEFENQGVKVEDGLLEETQKEAEELKAKEQDKHK